MSYWNDSNMPKETQEAIKAINRAKGEISFVLTRLIADLESFVAKPITFVPDAVLSPTEADKPPF